MLVRFGSPNIDGMARYLSRARTPGAILSVLASLSLLCAACSTGSTPSSSEEPSGSSAATSVAAATSAAGTRQVQTDLGEGALQMAELPAHQFVGRTRSVAAVADQPGHGDTGYDEHGGEDPPEGGHGRVATMTSRWIEESTR